jgi:hypothetical protein
VTPPQTIDHATLMAALSSTHHVTLADGSRMPETAAIALDLDSNGVSLAGKERGRGWFDINGEGSPDEMGWISRRDGFLVIDRNNNLSQSVKPEQNLMIQTATFARTNRMISTVVGAALGFHPSSPDPDRAAALCGGAPPAVVPAAASLNGATGVSALGSLFSLSALPTVVTGPISPTVAQGAETRSSAAVEAVVQLVSALFTLGMGGQIADMTSARPHAAVSAFQIAANAAL